MSTLAPYLARAVLLPALPEAAQPMLGSCGRDNRSLPPLAGLIGCMTRALPQPAQFDRLGFWRSMLAVSAYAQTVARAMKLDEDMAGIGGLLLRSGVVLMSLVAPERAKDVQERALEPDSRIGWEAALLGCTHPHISAALALHWGFPVALATALQAAADPIGTRPFNPLGAALRLASVVADCRAVGHNPIAGLRELQPELVQHLKLDLGWLALHLPDHGLVTAGADGLLH